MAWTASVDEISGVSATDAGSQPKDIARMVLYSLPDMYTGGIPGYLQMDNATGRLEMDQRRRPRISQNVDLHGHPEHERA